MSFPGHNNLERAARDPHYRLLYETDRARHESNMRHQKMMEESDRRNRERKKGPKGEGGQPKPSSGAGVLVMPALMALVLYGGWQIVTGEMAGDKGAGFWMLVAGAAYFVWKIRRLARS